MTKTKKYPVRILNIESLTHDVKQFTVTKPEGYHFEPGQATDVAVNQPSWQKKFRPFTFTCLNQQPYLEFIIKGYFDHPGVTQKLHYLKIGDELIIQQPWGTINFQGPGVFLAGGAGITPFIAIFRDQQKKGKINNNQLIFSNKTSKDIILYNELEQLFGNRAIFTLTREIDKNFISGRIDRKMIFQLTKNSKRQFYICGPKSFTENLKEILTELGVKQESLVFEK